MVGITVGLGQSERSDYLRGAAPQLGVGRGCPAPFADPVLPRPAPPAELFPAPVLRVARRAQGGVVLRCDTRLHPRARATPLRFAFYKYSRAVRRFGPAAEYTVPEPEAEELESHWCEAATASRSVRKRSAWLQLPGRGE